MTLLLGIDTGGTYTDAVLYDQGQGVIASAKALTTKTDLAIGIRDALQAVLARAPRPDLAGAIGLVSLSTTLATNAIVEGQGAPIALLLLGYPPDALELAGLGRALDGAPVAFLAGGHDVEGDEQAPLDLAQVDRAICRYAPQVAAFAVSGYFAVLNPAHELAVRQRVRQLSGLPVTCGHELTSKLNAPRRALTAALNARLIPYLQRFILAVQATLDELGIHAPLMVVKGDGSLIAAQVALERPVETILSGPAASVIGAAATMGSDHSSASTGSPGQVDALVIDMGGTTTDIALLKGGRPALNPVGATVGGWQTMVTAIDVHTTGLGGDSQVRWDERAGLLVGPQRVVPLSLLADQHPEVLPTLRAQLAALPPLRPGNGRAPGEALAGQFALQQWQELAGTSAGRGSLEALEAGLWEQLEQGPRPLAALLPQHSPADRQLAFWRERALQSLVGRGLVVLSSFTPTDAAHVLGYQADWSVEAARLGAALWARRLGVDGADATPQVFCRLVLRQVEVQLGRAVLSAALAQTGGPDLDQAGAWRSLFVDRALAGVGGRTDEPTLPGDPTAIDNSTPHADAPVQDEAQKRPPPPDRDELLSVSLTLHQPLVAIGAPVATYFPGVARALHTRLSIPPHASVANAVGAVVGSVTQTSTALIQVLPEDSEPPPGKAAAPVYRLHLSTGIQDFDDLGSAVQVAERETGRLAQAAAQRAGAAEVQVQVQRADHIFQSATGKDVFLDALVTATAVGRPRLV
jgi:N-methylhydantoinase A/oxoprolinase/acetone carboxylase beta subunit